MASSTPSEQASEQASDGQERLIDLALSEGRMVLPGIQGLFGFQLIVVFSDRFQRSLSNVEQHLHLFACLLTVSAIALIMFPAAFHRQAEEYGASQRILRVASTSVTLALASLAGGLTMELFLLTRVVTQSWSSALILAGVVALGLAVLWFVVPHRARKSGTKR